MPVSASEILDVIWGKLFSGTSNLDEARVAVIWDSRLPRLVTAMLAGAALGLSGAIFQGLLLNPLADPYTLGVSSGAACGASFMMLLGFGSPWILSAGAFSLAIVTLTLVMALARDEGHLSPTNLILAGVIMSAILSAALSFQKYLAGEQVASIVFWLLGSFEGRTWMSAAIVLAFLAPALLAALWYAVDLNIMTMGMKSAETLGVNTRKVRFQLLVAASLAAAAAVSVAGIIGFVGLIVPHLVRLATGPDHRSLIPLSTLGGAFLLLSADSIVRVVLPGDIPVGVLTALLAGPAFLIIFRKRMGRLAYD